jgi:hypothetical protein
MGMYSSPVTQSKLLRPSYHHSGRIRPPLSFQSGPFDHSQQLLSVELPASAYSAVVATATKAEMRED